MQLYFLYVLMGGIGIQNLRKAKLPSNVNIVELLFLRKSKHGDKYVVAIFQAENPEDAENFASDLQGLSTRTKGGYIQQRLYPVERLKLGSTS